MGLTIDMHLLLRVRQISDKFFIMCSRLFQIYQKRTPTFIAEITSLVASLLLLWDTPVVETCALYPTLRTFYWSVFLLSSL